ncbi:GNAT family N-acetyltransferase [Tenacibaculum sp. TC6]|uniref:GNAT family N-acetyltransferase n=1 Tax=Tenacibaculum sp. TC6 TaxID=3423223 RepID=UPI003D3647A5
MKEETTIFSKTYPNFGTVGIRLFDIKKDSVVLHRWVNQEYAVFWGMQNMTLSEVKNEYIQLTKPEHYQVFVGMYNNEPAFVLEQYQPQQDILQHYYNTKPSDCGVHIIVAPPKSLKIPNYTWFMFQSIMDFIFTDESIQRIVVEPDIRNKKMFALCQRIGFNLDKVIELPHKTAQLAFLNRETHKQNTPIISPLKRSLMNTLDTMVSPQQSVQHIQPETWQKATIQLIKKALSEFSHERLITPTVIKPLNNDWYVYEVVADDSQITYQFEAKILPLEHFMIKEATIKKVVQGKDATIDALVFFQEFRNTLGIDQAKLPVYLEEIISTLYSSAFKMMKGNPKAKELAVADFQTVEQSMTEGHPGFVANNGRIGFDSSDYRSYAPEAGNSFSLLWLAGHKSKAVYAAIDSLPYKTLLHQELDKETIEQFNEVINKKGCQPDDYLFIPIHPWQWFNKLALVFAPEIAKGDLICLGYGPDQYLAQQSIRTLFNNSHPNKFYTKSALSILNMGFMRGLPLYYLGTAPKMAVWLENLLYQDAFIQKTGFKMLSEIGSVSYVNPYFKEFGPHNDYNKMLASLWRESPYSKITKEQKPITMAALLHIDDEGNALLPELIKSSGLTAENWIQDYLKAYLTPLMHCFYQYDLVFMPHGENSILVLENNQPISILLKDITEEAAILNADRSLPEALKRMYAEVPENVKLLSIFTDIFDGFFRYLTVILEEHTELSAQDFWKLVATVIKEYQQQFPELTDKFATYDVFANTFKLSCLNRLQLHNNKQMIDLDDPVALLQFAGDIKNPIAVFKNQPQLENVL